MCGTVPAKGWRAEAHAVLPTGGTSDWKIPPPESWHLTATASSSAAWLPLRLRIMSRLLSSPTVEETRRPKLESCAYVRGREAAEQGRTTQKLKTTHAVQSYTRSKCTAKSTSQSTRALGARGLHVRTPLLPLPQVLMPARSRPGASRTLPPSPHQKKPGWLRRSSVSHARSRATEGSLSSSGCVSSTSTEQTGQARRGTLRSRRSSHSSMQLVWKRWPHGVRRRVCCPLSKASKQMMHGSSERSSRIASSTWA
eukprot:scaffold15581_cov66-Phaeocystis_antarctica.AAC.2